ncbi:DNA repair protein RecN [Austwickia sp. TVS 96-490-7B]|uniref:DNA repair protein RecN n=1 Tax=Austwickia sp. TVS 96-490-7B TaxID=2830843 RepID=UPI001C57B687|nr:DNA repair protein RecN [Austwickia sp. TVS 96-490-7B]MBW3086966.1 DNA repair protein RecN [Austwickia sp. TVS 96-490-7B]
MLRHMRIRGLGVIDDATLDLADGLNVLTGETGAGKTMVVSGLGLLLGARADAGMVRHDVRHAVVEGSVELPSHHPARERALEAGALLDNDDDLILTRTVSGEGRSKAHVGGRQAPVAILAELGELLVAVHGQADQWRLRRPEQHRVVLDEYGAAPLAAAAHAYTHAYRALAATQAELRRVTELARDRAVETEVLRTGLDELERLDPQPGEDEELRAEDARLSHSDALRFAAGAAHDALRGEDDTVEEGATGLLTLARNALAAQHGHDPQLDALEARTTELVYLVADLGTDLAAYLDHVDADPVRLAAVQERRAALARLTRTYGDTIDDVLEWGRRAALRLDELDGAHDRVEILRAQAINEQSTLVDAALALSRARHHAASALSAAVTAELGHLAMGRARIDVAVERHEAPDDGLPLPDGTRVRFGPHGIDNVEIRLAANPGAPARSVAKAASGGELSRVMLALEVVTAATPAGDTPDPEGHRPDTFVFDEVDAGVGGQAALAVGARLARLARHAQVVVVTHLPQVAAYADRHLVVHKSSDGHITSSGVSVLDDDARLSELARMMAGHSSEVALEHARELLEQARRRRDNTD